MSDRIRNLIIIIIVTVTLALVTWLSAVAASNGASARRDAHNASNAADQATEATKSIASALAKRSPITQFDAAVAFHNDCRKDLEDAYFAAIGLAFNPSNDDSQRAAAVGAAYEAGVKLAQVEIRCPTPLPASIAPDGTVIQPPVIPEQYQCLIDRRPCGP